MCLRKGIAPDRVCYGTGAVYRYFSLLLLLMVHHGGVVCGLSSFSSWCTSYFVCLTISDTNMYRWLCMVLKYVVDAMRDACSTVKLIVVADRRVCHRLRIN